MNSGVNSSESARTGCESPLMTGYSDPSTSILMNAGTPWSAISRSSVVTDTARLRPHRCSRNLPLFVTASIHSFESEESVLASLIMISAAPCVAPSAL